MTSTCPACGGFSESSDEEASPSMEGDAPVPGDEPEAAPDHIETMVFWSGPLEERRANTESDDDREPVEQLAEDFLRRQRLGERPTVEEYVDRYPSLAPQIRELFAALLMVEDLRPESRAGTVQDGPERKRVVAPPDHLGGFRIVREIGRGGMGVVYEAVQESLGRLVALKVMPNGSANKDQSVRRFLREAEVNGLLEHPGIVPVHGLDRDAEGRPFYAMRMVRGGTLRDAIARFHEAAGGPDTRPLELRHLLRRFIDACNAVDYAHSKRVLHRDLKPENILLGSFGETLVVDWGLAKALGDADAGDPGAAAELASPGTLTEGGDTHPGQILGTPRYMSPEQATGHLEAVGPRSDVYGLGACLYELLTGRAAFGPSGLRHLLYRVSRGHFPRPHQVTRGIPPAMESICLKAMALAPTDRYGSAGELAADVERWLADEAVSAHRDGAIVRLSRLARRHRTAVVGAGVLLLTATAALAIGTILIGRESVRREVLRKQAVRNFAMARDAVDRMLSRVGDVELAEVPQMEAVRRQLLEEALQFYVGFLRLRSDDPDFRLELSRARLRLARVQELLGDIRAAERSYRDAIVELDLLGTRSSAGASARHDIARAHDGVGQLLRRDNRFREAEAELRNALHLQEVLARESPADPELRRRVADVRYHLGALLARTRDRGREDEEDYLAAVAIQRELVKGARGRPELRADLARSLNNLGMLLAEHGRVPEAVDAFREAASLLEDPPGRRIGGAAGRRWLRARALSNLGVWLRDEAGRPHAEGTLRQARTLLEELTADFPSVPDYRRDLASVHNNLGLLLAARGDRDAAESTYAEALRLREALVAAATSVLPDDHQRLAETRLNLGVLRLESDPGASRPHFREAVGTLRRLVDAQPAVPEYQASLGTALAALGRSAWRGGQLAEARRSLEQAIQHHQAALNSPHDAAGRVRLHSDYGILALVLEGLGDHVGMAAAAARLPELFPDRGDDYLRAAAFLVRCAGLAVAGASPDASRGEPKQAYLALAVDWLRRARDRGLIADPSDLDRPDFAPLRDREDFKALVTSPTPSHPSP